MDSMFTVFTNKGQIKQSGCRTINETICNYFNNRHINHKLSASNAVAANIVVQAYNTLEKNEEHKIIKIIEI